VRWIGRIAKWAGTAVLVLALLGVAYNQVGLALDASLAPPAGEMVQVKGRAIHVRCDGDGAQTFLLDAGAGGWSLAWFRIQPLLAKEARVCSFDRSGMGWSDDLGGAHDAAAVADELRAIVSAAGIKSPFVYVGHSLGANFAQTYYAKYPGDIAGLVLLEPGNPKDLLEDFRGTREDAMRAPDCDWKCPAAFVASHLGVVRLGLLILGAGSKSLPPDLRAKYRAGLARPSTLATTLAYLHALPKIAHQNMDVPSFGATPVLTIGSSNPRTRESGETQTEFEAWGVAYRAHLGTLAAKSSKGVGPMIVPDSTHSSMVTGERQAAWIVAAILDFARTFAPADQTASPADRP
jgi:pimeloyl-ACP methyl ester carboxylesterase